MTKVLIYENRKCPPVVWDVSTPDQEAAAWLALFHYLDDEWQCYDDLKAPDLSQAEYDDGLPPKRQKELYRVAAKGVSDAAKRLLAMRKTYEYENWTIVQVEQIGRKR
jgi:hypothetical protein